MIHIDSATATGGIIVIPSLLLAFSCMSGYVRMCFKAPFLLFKRK